MRIGIFGGSFDPIHNGHLIVAEQCRDQARLDEVWFMPCHMQPLKETTAHGTPRQRSEMIEMAIAGHHSFSLSKIELERGNTSYTVDTLEQIHGQRPDDELFLIMGNDSLETFSRWRNPARICELATPLVVGRPGCDGVELSVLEPFVGEERMQEFLNTKITSPQIEISSSDLRQRIASQDSVRYLLPRSVEKYIETKKLYEAVPLMTDSTSLASITIRR